MNFTKTIVSIPEWAERFNRIGGQVDDTASAYAKVPLVHHAVELRGNALTAVPFHLYIGEGDNKQEVEWDKTFPASPLKDLLKRTETSLLLTGKAYWLNMDLPNGKCVGAQWINPYSIERDTKLVDGMPVTTYTQKVDGKIVHVWDDSQITYFHTFDPRSDEGGLGAVSVAMTSAKLKRYLELYPSAFFEGGAMPVTVVGIKNEYATDAQVKEVANIFQRMVSGLQKAFGVVGLRGDFAISKITPDLNTMAFPDLSEQSIENIAYAFDIPKSILLDSANYATASEDHKRFYQGTIVPVADYICETANRGALLKGTGFRLEANPEEMDIFQDDEADRATSLKALTDAGMPLLIALDVLGYDLEEDQIAMIGATNQPAQPSPQVVQNTTQTNDTPITDHLRMWERKAIKRLKSGSAACGFESEYIPETLAASIQGALEECKTPEAVKSTFSNAIYWMVYP